MGDDPKLVVLTSKQQQLIVARTERRDTKYKTDTFPDAADLYQMVAYCRALSINRALLIPVGSKAVPPINIRDGQTS